MRHIRQLTGAADFAAMAAIGADAYPGTKVVTEEDRLKLQQQLIARAEQPTVAFSGLFDDQRLLGGMQLHDFSMNMFGTMVAAGGVGIMYRVVNARALFERLADRDFGGQTCKLKLTVNDSFLPENGGELVVHFHSGHATMHEGGDYDLAIQLDIAEFSALLMGVVSFTALQRYSLAAISDVRAVGTVNRLFLAEEKPICMTLF